jgi:hypothetical protein
VRRQFTLILIGIIIGLLGSGVFNPLAQAQSMPFDRAFAQAQLHQLVEGLPDLNTFRQQVHNGLEDQIVGLYLPDLAAIRLLSQPADEPYNVTQNPRAATLFLEAQRAGSIGVLAHNHLAGAAFSQLRDGQPVVLVYGDGQIETYQVLRIESYQATLPDDPHSEFVSLQDGSRWDSRSLFTHLYASGPNLILQTCIEEDGLASWGRLFVIASSIEPLTTKRLGGTGI